jgi:hypothetical protein
MRVNSWIDLNNVHRFRARKLSAQKNWTVLL